MLCVQRTGWGKSAVYFLATSLLRETGRGSGADRLAAAGADAQPDRRRREARDPRPHDQLDQPRRVGRGASTARDGRGRPAADQPRAAQQPAVPGHDAAAVRRARRAAGDRRGALHLRLGPRLPARLPAHPGHARAAARGRRRALHDRDRERPRGRRRLRAAPARRAASCAPTAGRSRAPRCGWRSSSCPPRPTASPGSPRTCRSCRAPASSTRSPSATPTPSRSGSTATASPAEAYSGEVDTERRDRGRGAPAAQRPQVRGGHERARHGLRQARPRLRRALPGARQRHLLLPAGRPRGARDRAGGRGPAARPRGPPDPGLLHRAGVPAEGPRGPRARGARRRRRDDQRADGRGQPRQGPDRGDAEGARRRGRGHARGHAVAARAGRRLDLRRRPLRARHRSCAGTSRRRWRRSAPTAAA